jgi:cold shock CspA family protein
MFAGTVTWFSEVDGYGFVRPDDSQTPVRVELREIVGVRQPPGPGERVEVLPRAPHRRLRWRG